MKRGLLTISATLLALAVVAGGAAAAGKYLITSTHQIKPSVLNALKGNVGPRGPQGAQGAPGQAGAPGAAGVTTVHDVSSSAPICAFGSSCDVAQATATCPGGTYTVGGSANVNTIETPISTFASATSYGAVANDDGSFGGTLTVTAICASGNGMQYSLRSNSSAGTAMSDLAAELRSQQSG